MKTLFHKKVCTFFFAFLITGVVVRAQIVYTDVNPDQTFITNNASYILDLNNDGLDDFRFNISMVTTPFSQNAVSILPLNGGEYADMDGIPGATFPLPLQLDQLIASHLSWETGGHKIIYAEKPGSQWQVFGAWFGGAYFIGLRIHTGPQTFYGWVQLKAKANASGASFTIYDYGYNSSLKTITAGQKCPPPAVVIPNGPTTFCEGDNVVLSANSGVGFSYQWKLNDVNIKGATGKDFTATAAGKYKVKVVDNIHGCSKTSAVIVVVTLPCLKSSTECCPETLNVDPASENKELSIFPNPASNQFTIQLPMNDEASLQIINLVGETVFEGKIKNGAEVIDVSSLAKGWYMISVRTPVEKYFSKFLKQ